ncbi:hypothetical protein, partial [Vibrio splendidus]|uniref:hypothetical protein n=1 Tax=Vibrio splendidus TaxID=29497 RepID=UPI001A7E0897
LISIYISRVLLDIMGIDSFGVFSVVSSAVTMFSFINNSLAYGTQRFVTFELGKGDLVSVNKTFLMSLNIHIILSIIILISAILTGHYLIYDKLTIPTHQLDDAYSAYLLLMIGFFVSLVTTPYLGVLIASEKFDKIAIFGVVESIFKLLATFLLYYALESRVLSIYAALLLCVTLIVRGLHILYVHDNIDYCRIYLFWNSSLFKKMFSFSSWGLFGGISSILMNQGSNIILNIFFGPAINAARALSLQINNAMSQFSSSLQMLFKPRIIKNYAAGDLNMSVNTTLYGAKYNYFLIFYLALPIYLCSKELLVLWLGVVPDYTEEFLIVLIFILLSESLSGTLMALASATGDIKKYQISVGIILLLNLPITYILLENGYGPVSSVYVQLVLSILALFVRLIVLESHFKGLCLDYLKLVFLRVLFVTMIAFPIAIFIYPKIFVFDFLFLNIICCFLFTTITLTVIFFIAGLNNKEKSFLIEKIHNKRRG